MNISLTGAPQKVSEPRRLKRPRRPREIQNLAMASKSQRRLGRMQPSKVLLSLHFGDGL